MEARKEIGGAGFGLNGLLAAGIQRVKEPAFPDYRHTLRILNFDVIMDMSTVIGIEIKSELEWFLWLLRKITSVLYFYKMYMINDRNCEQCICVCVHMSEKMWVKNNVSDNRGRGWEWQCVVFPEDGPFGRIGNQTGQFLARSLPISSCGSGQWKWNRTMRQSFSHSIPFSIQKPVSGVPVLRTVLLFHFFDLLRLGLLILGRRQDIHFTHTTEVYVHST